MTQFKVCKALKGEWNCAKRILAGKCKRNFGGKMSMYLNLQSSEMTHGAPTQYP
jgi:hypothetical protein